MFKTRISSQAIAALQCLNPALFDISKQGQDKKNIDGSLQDMAVKLRR
jgi:hypothetical protein